MEIEQTMISILRNLFTFAGNSQGEQSYIQSDLLKKIELEFTQISIQMPESFQVQCCYGMLLAILGRYTEARLVYQRAVAIHVPAAISQNMNDRRMVMLLHNNNDLDHIAPVIYKWSQSSKGTVTVIWAPDSPDHKNCDILLNYIKQLPRVFLHTLEPAVLSMIALERELRDYGLPCMNSTCLGLASALLYRLAPQGEKTVFVTDFYVMPLIAELCAASHERGIKCIALPHGETVSFNRKVLEHDISISLKAIDHEDNAKAYLIFDRIVFPSKFLADFTDFVPEEKRVVLGSARNSFEWLTILSSIIPRISFQGDEGKLKIVFFIPSSGYAINSEEIPRTIKLLASFPDIFLIVKLHPRATNFESCLPCSEYFREVDPSKVLYVDNDIYTAQLIEWGDVFLSIATGAVFHPLKLGKPVLELSYMMGFMTVLAKHLTCTDIRSKDHLIELIWKFKKLSSGERSVHYYNREELEKFISIFIDNGSPSALELYVDFLCSV